MNNLKIGDRVRIVSGQDLSEIGNDKIKSGMTGTVKGFTDLADETFINVEFDEDISRYDGNWEGEIRHCWYLDGKYLEKIEEMDAEGKSETIEQKILEVLREEIGVEIGEEFDVYKKGNMLWRCKFEGNGFFRKGYYEFQKAEVWKNIIVNFHEYTFKRKLFVPEYEENYFFLSGNYDGNKNMNFRVMDDTWINSIIDYGRLALGDVFRSKEEALASKDKLLEKMEKLRKGEV